MGTITGQAIADNAASLIQDTAKVRWTDADWLVWLNDGHRDAVLAKPDINVQNQSTLLTANTTKQSLPTGATQLFGVIRNMGADGNTVGKAIRVVSKDSMDTTDPNWHTEAASGEITNYVYDPRDPKTFYVYPQAPATAWYVEIAYSQVPTALSTLSETINLDDLYANALLHYMLYRAYSRDDIYADHVQESTNHYQMFTTALGLQQQNEVFSGPNMTTGPVNPAIEAATVKPV